MRTSAHSIKTNGSGSRLRTFPRPGSRLAHYYALAMRGDWFSMSELAEGGRRGVRDQLRDRYELELIRRPDPQSDRAGNAAHQQYKCIGVWDGTVLRSLEDVEVTIDFTKQGEQ